VNSASPVTASSWHRVAGVLIALWAGGVWTVCGIVAPTLFSVVADRHLAGELAARFFLIATVEGVAIGVLLLALRYHRRVHALATVPILVAAGLPAASHVILGPLMEQARSVGNMALFGMLHGIAALCFVLASAALVVLTWKFNRPAE
jgi:hypothetical protein